MKEPGGRLCRTWPGRVCRSAQNNIVKSLLITDLYIFFEIETVARPLQTALSYRRPKRAALLEDAAKRAHST
jgi:hypothetical protein